jgi:hypothetical protein
MKVSIEPQTLIFLKYYEKYEIYREYLDTWIGILLLQKRSNANHKLYFIQLLTTMIY